MGTKKMTKELIDEEGTNIRTKAQAIEFLTKFQYLAPGETPKLPVLAHILLQMTHSAGRLLRQIVDGMRAVVIVMEDIGIDQAAEEIAKWAQDRVEEYIQMLKEGSSAGEEYHI